MQTRNPLRCAGRLVLGGIGLAAGAYAGYAAMTWLHYGHVKAGVRAEDRDTLLDEFMPAYDVVERHHTRVQAPAPITLAAAKDMDLSDSPLVRAIFAMREMLLRASPDNKTRPRGILAQTRALGWGVLAEVPDREIVMGAVTRPWESNVTFHSLPPDEFADFYQPGFVKIAWTLRADPLPDGRSMFRTETRALATDAEARRRFRRYWAAFSPGIILIRRAMLRPVRHEAERRARIA
jgi:hypothetical protein